MVPVMYNRGMITMETRSEGSMALQVGDWVRVSVDGLQIIEAMIKEVYKDRLLVETANGYQKWVSQRNIVGLL